MWTKICGIRDLETARWVAALGPSALGLNFFPRSPRVIDAVTAAKIGAELGHVLELVGVFVNHPTEEIAALVEACRLTTVQMHGDEPPQSLAEVRQRCPHVKLIRSWTRAARWDRLPAYLEDCSSLDCLPAAILVDAPAPGVYGGTGETVDWNTLRTVYNRNWPPLILAGGLTAENIAEAIRTAQPWGVDVASGVESAPGVKDRARVAAFLAAIRQP